MSEPPSSFFEAHPRPDGLPPGVLDHLVAGVWSVNSELRITYGTGRLLREAIPAPRSIAGLSVADLFDERDPSRPPLAQHLAALQGATQLFRYDWRNRCLDVRIEPIRLDDGSIVGCAAGATDVTESQRALDRLEQSERALSSAQRIAHFGSFAWDISTDVFTWSETVDRIFGFEPSPAAHTYADFVSRVHPDDRAEVERRIFEACRTGEPFAIEHRIVHPDGAVRALFLRGEVAREGGGIATRIVGSCLDITDLHDTQDKLQQTIAVLHATLDATADGILAVDREQRVIAYNERFAAMWHLSPSALAMRDDDVLLEEVRDQLVNPDEFVREVREVLERAEGERLDVLRFKDGKIFERYSRPQRIGREIVGRVWSFRDVTERARLYDRAVFLSETARLLVSLDLENALEAVAHACVPFIGDACAVDLFGNGAPRRVLSVSRDPAFTFAGDLPAAVMEGHGSIFAVGPRCYMAVPLVVKAQTAGAMTFVAVAGRVYTSVDLELAETLGQRASLAVENARLYRGAREALQARDEFLSIVAHEIRNPIASIHLAAHVLRGNAPPNAQAERAIGIIEREDRRLSGFVDDLLDVGRVRTGRLHFTLEEVDLVAVVREVVSQQATELARAGSPLSMTGDVRVVGRWDRERLQTIATHLLSNAIKFGRGRPVEITATLVDGKARLSVTDHGIGIAPERRPRIFQPFERAVSLRHYGGLGLGLFIVKTLVEGLGGHVTVESEPGAGSTFTVELPTSGQS